MSVERKRFECSALPRGWQREEVMRKNGLSAGKVDVYYYSPDGRKVRSKPQLARCLGDVIDYGSFDFRSGKVNNLLLRKQRKQRSTQVEYSRGVRTDASLVPPIRQTASIFKQPVTVYKTQEGKVKNDFKHGPQEKPKQDITDAQSSAASERTSLIDDTLENEKQGGEQGEGGEGSRTRINLTLLDACSYISSSQLFVYITYKLFWEKRLEGLRACDVDGHELCAMELPRSLRAVGPHVTEETLLQSVATALHVSSQPVTGQTGSRTNLEKNPGVFINPDQPLVQAVAVGDEDIKRQEDRVNSARVKLQEAIKAMTA